MRIIENPDEFRLKICVKMNAYFPLEKDAKNLEIGVYNWALKEAKNKKVVKKWDNPYFVQIYTDRLRSVYINIKNYNLLKNPSFKSFRTDSFI